MNARFEVDLLHPGGVARTWRDWLVGPRGWQRLALLAAGGAAILLAVLVAGILPAYWRLSGDLHAVPALRRALAARDSDLGLLRSGLGALSQEARRQVRWADLLTTLSGEIPPALKLRLVEAARVGPPAGPGLPSGAAAKLELRIEAITPLRPGSPPLLVAAQFMAGLMRDPAVSRRFHLKSWEIKPGVVAARSGEPHLGISIALAERAQ